MTSAHRADPTITTGVQLPEAQAVVIEGESVSVLMLEEDFAEEYAMVAEMACVEVLELWTLAEVKRHPDWPLWEKGIQEELVTL